MKMKEFQLIRKEKTKNQPVLLTDKYYLYNNKFLIEDTYTAKKLYNMSLYDRRQAWFKKKKKISNTDSYHLIKNRADQRENMLYRQMHLTQAAVGVIRQVGINYNNFFSSLRKYIKNPSKFKKEPNLPKYLRHPRTSFQLENQAFSTKNGFLSSRTYSFKLRIYKHYDQNGNPFIPKYHNIWVVPVHRGVELCCSYEAPPSKSIMSDNEHVCLCLQQKYPSDDY